MYRIGDNVLDKNGKVFTIDAVEDKDFGKGPEPYFVLTPYFPYDFNPGYHAYVPQAKSASLLRPIMDKEEALALIDSFSTLETYPDVSPRERKMYFTKVVASGDRKDVCRVIKTLQEYREERMKDNKPFSDFDKRLLSNLKTLLYDEISLSLSIPESEVSNFISERTGIEF